MGSLTLPSSGPIYLDANGFIYSVEHIEPYRTILEPMWMQAKRVGFDIVSSELVILEPLVKPFQEGDVLLENLFRALETEINRNRSVRRIRSPRMIASDPASTSLTDAARVNGQRATDDESKPS